MDTKVLRQKILDLAIRGKLVPQDPSDEPASVLLERIRTEKQKMVKDGKLKAKDIKNDTIIFKSEDNLYYEKFQDGTVKCIEDEIPFEVPKGWEWCRGRVCFKGMKSQKPCGNFFDYIDIESINNKLHTVSHPKRLKVKEAPSRANRKLENGSVLFSLVRPYLENIAYIDKKYSKCIASTGFYVCNSSGVLFPQYMFILMTSRYVIEGLTQFMKGDNSPSIRKEDIENWLYPIPPFKEQQLIVKQTNSILQLIANIQTNKEDLANYITNVKSKILDLAIRGKLVPQDPNDEPASVLLERIHAEKEELIKQGKLKRNKKESIIFRGDDNSYYEQTGNQITSIDKEIPFDIPDNWTWCRLKELAAPEENAFIDGPFGSNLKTEHYTSNEEVRIVQLNNIGILEWKNTGKKYTTYKHAEIISRCISFPGDIVIAKMMPAGRTIILPNINDVFVISSDCVRLRPTKLISNEFLLYMLNSKSINALILKNVQGIGRTRTSLSKLKEILVPIPPISEQLQIIDKIRQLYLYTHSIEENIL